MPLINDLLKVADLQDNTRMSEIAFDRQEIRRARKTITRQLAALDELDTILDEEIEENIQARLDRVQAVD